jgi:hypothetical protein
MAWNPVITNIVTTPSLTTTLANYPTLTTHNTDLALKLDKTNGLATDLKLTGSMSTPDSAVNKSYVDTAISPVTSGLAAKADKASPTFTGTVTVPTGVAGTSAVNLTQLQLYLPKTGGTVTGLIKSSSTPSADDDLTNKLYVDTTTNTKASNAALTSAIDDLEADTASTYIPFTGGTFTGTVSGPTPAVDSNGNELATTSFVVTAIEDAVGPALMTTSFASDESVDAKLELMAPQVGAQLMNAQVVNEDLTDDTQYIASHYYVKKAVKDLVREALDQILAEQNQTGDK